MYQIHHSAEPPSCFLVFLQDSTNISVTVSSVWEGLSPAELVFT